MRPYLRITVCFFQKVANGCPIATIGWWPATNVTSYNESPIWG
ncbi:hypothetical protein DESPIG_02958 [Desulfovibrio piger ATCC 29098]|uniref:Uncharacterized protein n=1 Tax=Desulfovibrio piger ATCC 29098 TaxID=411464 RepID=B6WXX8_9BACT|nr:hypothetical protein DESPIG_02958 [Desulfovibrio piger ATCC 29098]